MRILYVDDEPKLLEIAKSYIEATSDAEVVTCGSAAEALELIPSQGYKAVISDYQMPEMDGIEFLKVVRSRWPSLPFILFTGKGREEVAMEALHNGADSYIMKGGDAASQFKVLCHEVQNAVARREAEEAVHYNLSRFNLIMRNISDVIFMITMTGDIVYVSPSITSVLGYTREEVEGRNVEELRPLRADGPSRYSSAMEGLKDALTEAGMFFQVSAKDGSVHKLHVKATVTEQEGGRTLIATAKDVSRFEEMEARLCSREQLFATVMDQMPIAAGITNALTGEMIHVNKKASEVLGFTRDEMVGRRPDELGFWEDDELSRRLPPGGMAFGVAIDITTRGGRKQAFVVNVAKILVDEGPFIFFMILGKAGETMPRIFPPSMEGPPQGMTFDHPKEEGDPVSRDEEGN